MTDKLAYVIRRHPDGGYAVIPTVEGYTARQVYMDDDQFVSIDAAEVWAEEQRPHIWTHPEVFDGDQEDSTPDWSKGIEAASRVSAERFIADQEDSE